MIKDRLTNVYYRERSLGISLGLEARTTVLGQEIGGRIGPIQLARESVSAGAEKPGGSLVFKRVTKFPEVFPILDLTTNDSGVNVTYRQPNRVSVLSLVPGIQGGDPLKFHIAQGVGAGAVEGAVAGNRVSLSTVFDQTSGGTLRIDIPKGVEPDFNILVRV
ncbi:MAG: hypothetical protein WC841_03530 [Candidatus Shapirobacteria bacterium]|jgi:hypothetical protein